MHSPVMEPVNESTVERWAWRFFLGGFCVLPVSTALGQTLLIPAVVLQTVFLIQQRRVWRWPLATWGASLYLLIVVLATLRQPELLQGWDRLSGLRWLALLPVAATFINTNRRRTAFLAALTVGSLALTVETLVQNPLQARQAMQAGEPWAQDFFRALIHEGGIIKAQFLMLGLLATLGLLALRGVGKMRLLLSTALALQVLAFILHFKRGSWVCFLPLFVVWILFRMKGRRRWIPMLALIVTLASLAAVPAVRYRVSQTRHDLDAQHGGRWTMWTQVTPGLVRDYPLGLGFRQLTNDKMREYAPHVEPMRNHLHSNIAQTLADAGWPGLAAYLLWMGGVLALAVRRLWRVRCARGTEPVLSMTYLLMLIALLTNGLVEFNFGTTALRMILMVIMACLETPEQAAAVSRNA